jgi:hypothetical protein
MTIQRTRTVDSFAELISTPFRGDINALCWSRQIRGNFQEIIDHLHAAEGITALDDDDLRALNLSPAASLARDALLADQALLRRHGLSPSLDCVMGYPRDASDGPVATDVYSWHVDRAPVPADTFLCTYTGGSSEGLPNETAVRRVDVAETRAELLALYGGADDEDFATYLAERSFDLHYCPTSAARPYSFGLGNLWRIAIAYPGAPVLPCIHRAPLTPPGAPARLLLIS